MNNKIYLIMLVASLALFILSFTVLADTEWLGGITIGLSIYFFLGAIIKICKTHEKFKNAIICAIDLLFWLP